MSAFLRLLLLTTCNVISLKCKNSDVAENDDLFLCIYMCVSSMNLIYVLCYTMDMLREWHLVTVRIDLIGQSFVVHA